MKNCHLKPLLLKVAIALVVMTSAHGQDSTITASGNQDSAQLGFIGSQSRVGLGFTDDGDFLGEGLVVFADTEAQAWIAEGWLNDGAGGLKLNYHWTRDQQKVWKTFVSVDRNKQHDRKANLGLGLETSSLFAGVYASKSLTDGRLVNTDVRIENEVLNGFESNHNYTQSQTTTTTTLFYEHPYNHGVGARVGKYYDDGLWRVRGGFDYETGDFDSSQATFSVGVEKFFKNTGHSLALTAEHLNKDGDFETNKTDNRASLVWRYDFGKTYQPRLMFKDVEYQKIIPARSAQYKQKIIKNRANLNSETFFDLDSSKLRENAESRIGDIVSKLSEGRILGKISVTGHTCDLGSQSYNLTLSERRAQAVADAMVRAGIDPEALVVEGKGELSPEYSNGSEDNRKKNRRVNVSFVGVVEVSTQQEVTPAIAETTELEWRQEEVKTAPQWLKRALRNPIAHKRAVDVYKYQQQEINVQLGEKEFSNADPVANEDVFTIVQSSADNFIDVLGNDVDADGDAIHIVSVGTPQSGTVENFGDYLVYTPVSDFNGSVNFTYTIEDEMGAQSSADITIVVQNQAPVLNDDHVTVAYQTHTYIDVLFNDVDPEGDSLELVSVDAGGLGVAVISNGVVSYTPADGYIGTVQFQYVATDGSNQSQGNITVEVVPPGPEAEDDRVSADAGVPRLIDVLANDSAGTAGTLSIYSVGEASHGTVSISGDSVIYTAEEGYEGSDSFHYTIQEEGNVLTSYASVLITVFTTPNTSPVAVDDSVSTALDQAITIDVLQNDSDPDGDSLTVVSMTELSLPVGTIVLNTDQTITFTPNDSWTGTKIRFEYTISDGRGGTATARVEIKC